MGTKLTKVGKYKIQSQIAEGGMGAVLKATHPTLNTDVILKRLTLEASGGFVERFKREAKISLHLKHDHIIQVYDHFKEGSSYYLVMEYVDGEDLESVLTRKRYLSNEQAMLIFTEICRGLLYAHEHGVIHRDIKPANILISHTGQVKIADFGISTFKEGGDDGLTKAGASFGTPSYMSPEQFDDTKSVDNRADIYSMGVLLYELVTGKKPFAGGLSPTNIAAIQKGKYTRPRKINPHVTPLLQRVIRKAMHKKKKRRYASLKQIITIFEKQLKRLDDQPTINQAIKEIVFEDSDKTLMDHKHGSFGRVVRSAGSGLKMIGAAAILGAGAFLVYWQGWHHELLSRDSHGRLQVAVNLGDYPKAPDDIFIKVNIYNTINGKADTLVTALQPFRARYDSTSTSWQLISRRIYLPSGPYIIDLALEGHRERTSILLAPRLFQVDSAPTADGQLFTFNMPELEQDPVQLSYEIVNSITGTPVRDARLQFSRGKGWQNWPESQADFIPGRTYRFRAQADGYENANMKLRVASYQSTVHLRIPLIPKAGELEINAEEPGLELLLNNSRYYITGGQNPAYRLIGVTGIEPTRLSLAPGTYYLTVKKQRLLQASRQNTVQVVVASGQTLRLEINYDPETETFNLTH
ncbi:MAG: serine/threonine protein kinase [Candidatus Marinimicrobia bacterium]|nr:serine/threonine protein kinase [Candidatus Neomarinimicrobiota bacterium]